ncbi:MAG: RDD family protein [Acidobacteria bacterium]|nr:RDD family protein [Acidobacteriota bacterium]
MTPFPDDQHIIETPEQARLEFSIAGIGSRFLALAIDSLIQAGVALLAVILFAIMGMTLTSALARASSVWTTAALLFILFSVYYGYFAVFEIAWRGQTPGKRAIQIRVVKDTGRPLTPAETIARNLLRIVDQMPGFYAIGIIAAALSPRNKRLGDYVAGSMLVREGSLKDIKPVWSLASSVDPAPAPLTPTARLTSEELALVDAFLNRRWELPADVRARLAADVVSKLGDKRPAGYVGTVEGLLEALAYEARQSG